MPLHVTYGDADWTQLSDNANNGTQALYDWAGTGYSDDVWTRVNHAYNSASEPLDALVVPGTDGKQYRVDWDLSGTSSVGPVLSPWSDKPTLRIEGVMGLVSGALVARSSWSFFDDNGVRLYLAYSMYGLQRNQVVDLGQNAEHDLWYPGGPGTSSVYSTEYLASGTRPAMGDQHGMVASTGSWPMIIINSSADTGYGSATGSWVWQLKFHETGSGWIDGYYTGDWYVEGPTSGTIEFVA